MAKPVFIRWYFDFISPFAYLQHHMLSVIRRQRPELKIDYTPVLFAGLLTHHEHKGPAEIPAKREMTYRYCHWYANRHGIEFNTPAAHPFNPLVMLRLAIALDCREDIITTLFRHTWVESADNPEFAKIESIAALPGCDDVANLVAGQDVKDRLRQNTESAIAAGVFGVPTLEIDSHLFWGMDMTDMALDYIEDPGAQSGSDYQRLERLPIAQARKR